MTEQPFFLPALLIGIASILLILGLVPRNRMYGFRTSKTLSDDGVWYRSNRFGGWAVILSCAVYLTVAYICGLTAKGGNFSLWLSHVGAFALPLIASIILTFRYARSH